MTPRLRFAVVGLGHFAQTSILPAFAQVKQAELVALVSGTRRKREALAKQYGVDLVGDYPDFESIAKAGRIDAVYLAVPNASHAEYTRRAAKLGLHVLCEKPMATSVKECRQMIDACHHAKVKLMCAYRLHFERTTLEAIRTARGTRLGDLKLFTSTFTQIVPPKNTRFKPDKFGGGPIFDVGVYCLNAARSLYGSEPTEVACFVSPRGVRPGAPEEQATVMMRFPGDRLANFAVSFTAFRDSRFQLIGDQGMLLQNPAYQMHEPLAQELTIGERTTHRKFAKLDQVAGELDDFCDCIRTGREPEPSGEEGMRDIRVIEAMLKSARTGKAVSLPPIPSRKRRPTLRQVKHKKLAHTRTKTVAVAAPHL